MNYLTNYYKNLSEQLEHKVNELQNQVRMINEATMSTGNVYGRTRDTMPSAGTWDQSYQSGIPGDFNGDGRVNGADLGLALGAGGNMQHIAAILANWTRAGGASVPSARSTSGAASNPSSPNIQGDYNGDGIVDGADLGLALGRGDDPNVVMRNWTRGSGGNPSPRSATQASQYGRGPAVFGGADSVSYGSVSGDYNGDGRVDGADLGLALGRGEDPNNVLRNWGGGNPYGMSTTGGPSNKGKYGGYRVAR